MKKILIAGLLGGLVLLIWSSVSWIVLPLHTMTINDIPGGDAAIEGLKENITEPGVYRYPGLGDNADEWTAKLKEGPRILMLYLTGGAAPFTVRQFVVSLILTILAASLVAYVLSLACDTMARFSQRVRFVALFGVFLILFVDLIQYNWWEYPFGFILANAIDNLVAWVLAGLVISWQIKPE